MRNKEREKRKKRSVKFYALIAAAALALIAALLTIYFFSTRIDQPVYSMGYVVKASPVEGCLNVEITIDILKLPRDRNLFLYQGKMTEETAQYISCLDESGNEVPFTYSPELVMIGPVARDSKRVYFKYNAFIGTVNEEEGFYGMPLYAQGCLFDDLITFSGEYTLLTPFLDPVTFDSMGKYVKSVSFEFIVPEGLRPIIPYQTPIDGQLAFTVDKPGWEFFNSISKSAFCFGHFIRYDYRGFFGDAAIYMDQGVSSELSQYTPDAMTGFLYYFTSVFGEPLGEVPIVLLRNNNDAEEIVIVGGAGSGGSAISAGMRVPDDFKAMSNLVYHTFFDSKIKPRNLRYTGNTWIYKGLAEYYVGNSIDYLPENVSERYSIGNSAPKSETYLRYLYYALKEPGFLAVGPANEDDDMYIPQEDFYMNIKIQVIIDAINYSIEQRSGQSDGFLKALVNLGKSPKPLDVEAMLKEICGPDYDSVTDYLTGKALVPNYRSMNIDRWPEAETLNILDLDEQKFSYFFERQYVNYPYIPMFLLKEEEFMSEVEKRGIRYNTDEIQDMVRQFSAVLHRILLQRAMWGRLAGIDDITLPNIIGILTEDDVIQKWAEFCENIGYEYKIED